MPRIRSGRLWALNTTVVPAGRRPSSARDGRRPGSPGTRAPGASSATPRNGSPAATAAAPARSRYCPTDSADQWGASTRPTTSSTPRPASAATPSSMVGSACFSPRPTSNRPGRRASSSPWSRAALGLGPLGEGGDPADGLVAADEVGQLLGRRRPATADVGVVRLHRFGPARRAVGHEHHAGAAGHRRRSSRGSSAGELVDGRDHLLQDRRGRSPGARRGRG